MIPHSSVYCAINSLEITAKISLVPVHSDSMLWKVNPCVMLLCCCYRVWSDEWNGIVIINNCVTLVTEECFIILLCEWTILCVLFISKWDKIRKELRGTFRHFTSFSFHNVTLLSYFSCVVDLELPCSQQIIRIVPVKIPGCKIMQGRMPSLCIIPETISFIVLTASW